MTDDLELRLSLYPDPVLRKVAQPVPAFDERLEALVEAMFERMYASEGVGLAAPQVGLGQRILVANPTGEPGDAVVLVNPTIVERTGPLLVMEEGCLSFPGLYAEVKRPERCRVEAFDPRGEPVDREFEGFLSRVIQHEYDHLEGVLLVDRMSVADKHRHKQALQELIDQYKASRGEAPSRRR